MTMKNDSEKVDSYMKNIYVYTKDVYSIIINVFNDESIAEELTQKVLFNAWKGFDTLLDINKSKAWVKAITRNVIREYMRKKPPYITADETEMANDLYNREELHEAEKDILDALVEKEAISMVSAALNSLDYEYQQIIREHLIGELSLKEIARRHNIKYGTLRVMYSRGVKMLRNAFHKLEKGGVLNG